MRRVESVVLSHGHAAHFEQNPHKLAQYVQTALNRGDSVPGFHLTQLARIVNLPLVDNEGRTYREQFPMESFVKPERFANIREVLAKAMSLPATTTALPCLGYTRFAYESIAGR